MNSNFRRSGTARNDRGEVFFAADEEGITRCLGFGVDQERGSNVALKSEFQQHKIRYISVKLGKRLIFTYFGTF